MLAQALESRASEMGEVPGKRSLFGRKSPDERFDAMLATCLEWQAALGVGSEGEVEGEPGADESRLLQVLKGSLRGAQCDPLAEALKLCYMEYSPLRFAGDLIFGALKRVVATLPAFKASS